MKSKLILYAEDDPADAYMMQRAFAKVDPCARLHRASDGEEVVDYLEGKGRYQDRNQFPLPVVLLLDIKMPRRSGLEVLAWLRSQQGELCRIPAVMFTSSRQSQDLARAYELGVNSYLVKPDTLDDLLVIIQSFDQYWLNLNEAPPPQ